LIATPGQSISNIDIGRPPAPHFLWFGRVTLFLICSSFRIAFPCTPEIPTNQGQYPMRDVDAEASHLLIVLHNDDDTPVDFIVELMHSVFKKSVADALKFAAKMDQRGRAICGTYPRDVANELLEVARQRIRLAAHPLKITSEQVGEAGDQRGGYCKVCSAFVGDHRLALTAAAALVCDGCMYEITTGVSEFTRTRQFEYACDALGWHFVGIPRDQLTATSRQFPGHMRADVQVAVDRLFSASPIRFFGIHERRRYETLTISALTMDDNDAPAIAPAQYHEVCQPRARNPDVRRARQHSASRRFRRATGHYRDISPARSRRHPQIALLAQYMKLARLLQPTMVVIEDVDLIARDRDQMGPCEESMLNGLLNEMDGLKQDADILFILTTNRPEQLESALASRPGRIDQAIEVPLPDDIGRNKLVQLYGKGLPLGDAVVGEAAQRTKGVSAAFIKELMRRIAQASIARDDGASVESNDISEALDDMLFAGGKLNVKLLGGALESVDE
jgi:ATP-dependent Clp protease adapter protein ClpS